MNRQAAYDALFDRLQGQLAGYNCTRELLRLDQCSRFPTAVILVADQTVEVEDQDTTPPFWRLGVAMFLYLKRQDAALFEIAIQGAIDQVIAALAPQPGEGSYGLTPYTTLGEVVLWARLRGTVQIDRLPGDQQAVVAIPLEMVTY